MSVATVEACSRPCWSMSRATVDCTPPAENSVSEPLVVTSVENCGRLIL
jgi:hypothetical protein